MSWGNEHSRNAKGNRFTVDDEDLDYEDEYMSAEPTQQYTEEYYAEEEPQVAAAVNVVFLNDAQKKKEAATEARKVQSANEAKNAAYIEDSKEWLAERGFLVSDMQPDAVVALRKTIEDNENRFTEEMDSIATLQLAGVRLMTSTRRVHLSTSQDYIGLDVSFGYPSTAPTGITVNSRTPRLAAIVNHILRTTEAFRSAGILVPLVKFSHSLINAADHDDWAPEWTALTGEVPKVMEQKEALVVTHKAPSMFSAAVRERMESASRQPKKPAKHSAASTIMAFGTSGTAYIEAHGYDTAVEGARNALMDHLSNVKDAQVQMLYYANRPLGILPPVISRMYQLTQIDFSGCGLSTLPDMNELRLQKLFLSRNLFERVPQGILSGKLVKSLRILDMAFNKIDELPSALGNFVNLEIMQFDYNKIRKLCSFARLEKLEVLELTDNALTTIPKTLGQLPKLWRLKIGANPIVGMPPEIYFQGIDKIKEFLNELTPHNLPVPAATLAADIASMLAKEVNGPDVVIVHAPSGTRIPALSFIVEARAPRLLSACQVTPLIDNDDGYTHQVIVADDSFSEDALRAFVRLLHCALTSDEIRSDSALQVGLSLLVASFGNQRLSHYLHDVERGTAVDLNEILGEDLDSVAREICDNALRDCNGDKFGHIVNFGVGAQGKIFSLHRSLICQRCDYMHSMLTSGLAESKMDVVPLPDVDPEVFEAFVTYLYTDANHKLTPENVVSLLFLAVEYQCARLRDMAECMVGYNVEVDNVAQVIQLAYFLDSTRLKRACIFFVSVNYAAVRKTEGFHQLQDELKLELSRMLDGVTVK